MFWNISNSAALVLIIIYFTYLPRQDILILYNLLVFVVFSVLFSLKNIFS